MNDPWPDRRGAFVVMTDDGASGSVRYRDGADRSGRWSRVRFLPIIQPDITGSWDTTSDAFEQASTESTRAAEGASADSAPRPISWEHAQAAKDGEVRYLSGIIRAGERAPLAFETGGRVKRIDVEVGDRFTAGDTLATLDALSLELELDECQAALSEVEASLADGQRDFERKRSLYQKGVEAEAAFLTSQAQLATLESRAAVSRTLIERARERLADATLLAPFAGSVAERRVEPAEFVQAGAAVLEVLGDGGGYELTVRVPDSMIDGLDPIGAYRVRIGRGTAERQITARIVEIGSRATTGAAFPVTLRLAETSEAVGAAPRPGTVAEVRLELNTPGIADAGLLRIPTTALVASTGTTSHVFVFDEATSTVAQREVRLDSMEGDHALVAGDLVEGEIVASRGASFLVDGQSVVLMGVGIARFDI